MKTVGQQVGQRDFNRTTIRSLNKKGVEIVGATWLPGTDGSFANGEKGYKVVINETMMIKTFSEILDIASKQ